MGTGDWNDGMNRVGEKGRGESVWFGWFLHAALMAFIPIAETRRETRRAATWSAHAAALQASLEREAWDGEQLHRAPPNRSEISKPPSVGCVKNASGFGGMASTAGLQRGPFCAMITASLRAIREGTDDA